MTKKIAIFGSSGLAREISDICFDSGYETIVFVDRREGVEEISGLRIASTEAAPELAADGYVFAIGVGNPRLRKKIQDSHPDLEYPNIIHPSACLGRGIRRMLDGVRGNVVYYGSGIANNAKLGNFGVYIYCWIGHDCVVGDFVTVACNAAVSGNVRIEDLAYVGAGATVTNGASLADKLRIGSGAVVGVGAVVTAELPDNHVIQCPKQTAFNARGIDFISFRPPIRS